MYSKNVTTASNLTSHEAEPTTRTLPALPNDCDQDRNVILFVFSCAAYLYCLISALTHIGFDFFFLMTSDHPFAISSLLQHTSVNLSASKGRLSWFCLPQAGQGFRSLSPWVSTIDPECQLSWYDLFLRRSSLTCAHRLLECARPEYQLSV